ncbi:type IV secretion system protein VirB3 [Novosphingobium acidiphilum]|jgi:type IV secretion system protein VirB3|uniref:type IV secretion system protein VirB3 n=1 Tax=Novosphingobium acidiphilum TaxID=505248 RepID=UPI0004921F85|nr:VirB3 family type IV secretion system protein [Novosphingobium acidiphilum]
MTAETVQERLVEDKVYLALTRPAVFMGLPLEALMPIGMLCMLVWALLHNPVYPALIFAALYFPARLIVHYEINAFRLIGLYCQTTYLARNKQHWGGGSYSPVAVRGAKRKTFAHG